jgi:glycosyltransferase involved in cell wall biosynthesis
MKLLFISYSSIAMDVTLPEREPLGGSESCIAYLARQLAQNGHDVSFAALLPPGTPERVLGVRHLPQEAMRSAPFFQSADFDAIITLGTPAAAQDLKRIAPRAFHVSWLHLTPDQKAMAPLAAMTPMIDCAVFVSETQRRMVGYRGAARVIGNGIAPAFENMFASADELRDAKENRAVYTSMPYRGLRLLVDVINAMQTQTRFDVYSGMYTYRAPENNLPALYDLVGRGPRTQYHAPVAQPALAAQLRSAAFLAYSCTFVETYCIAALEAIAAGLKVVSTELGALEETTLGFADLLPITAEMSDDDVVTQYAALLERNIAAFLDQPEAWAEQRFMQSQAVNRLCSWRARAIEWENLLAPAVSAKHARG